MANEQGWRWDRISGRYRDTSTGAFLSHSRVKNLRDQFTEARRLGTRNLFATYLPEAIGADPIGWNVGVRYLREKGWQEVERSMIAQYTFGRGGRNAMTDDDRRELQGMLRTQKTYWDGFMGEALDGRMSRDAVANRATMYDDASTAFYERGREKTFHYELPAHPGDGQTQCRTRCKCAWQISKKKYRIEAAWQTGGDNICPDCKANAQQWNPLIFEDAEAEADRLYGKASKAEPKVTRNLRTLEKQIDGDLNRPFKLANGKTVHPLDARLKTKDSTARKVRKDADDNDIPVMESADAINDNLRYTYTLEPDSYGQGVNTVLNGLDEMGYERVKVKNMWNNDEGYTGVHGIYRDANGQPFEVQFHTARTMEVKELISHPLYEVQRKIKPETPRWYAVQDQIDAAWRVIRDDPPNLAGLP